MGLWGLTPEEDAELRRLHFMLRFSSAAGRLGQRYLELRRRDRRVEIREPDDCDPTIPVQRSRGTAEPSDEDTRHLAG
jgi:hypothetical protein